MTRSVWLRRALLMALALIVLGAVGWFGWSRRVDPQPPRETVPVVWERSRLTPMHAAHTSRAVACERCHSEGFDEPPSLDVCTSCHQPQARRAHHGSSEHPTTCTSCHQFAAGRPISACASCHAHAEVVQAPLVQHETASCTSCHALHRDEPAHRDSCLQCHTELEAQHGRWHVSSDAGAADVAACSDCHAPHRKKTDAARTCVGCHVAPATAKSHLAAASAAPQIEPRQPAAHAACTTCHDGHRATRESVRACESCHADHRGASQVAGHAQCVGCHQPHAPLDAERACKGCHTERALGAHHVAEHARCSSCHEPHRRAPDLLRQASASSGPCGSCHVAVQPTHPSTGGQAAACRGCHVPHPSAAAPVVSACSSCHAPPPARAAAGERAFHRGAVACTDCHHAHQFDLKNAAPAICAGCHAQQASAVRAGHRSCEACHGKAHDVLPTPGCQTCHANEVRGAPAGHARCVGCHDGHSGSLGSHATCASCHRVQVATPHGALGTGCTTCHRAHEGAPGAARPPACSSCHALATLPGLHSVTAHAQNCQACHGGHEAPRAERPTCTGSCHQDRRTHQPEAVSCRGCHLFRR